MSTIAIGDEVALPQGHRAILRWIGRITGRAPIEYAGVEVIGPEATRLGKHSGTYQGRQYFRTEQPNTGLFVSYTQLVSANIKQPRLPPPSSPSMMSMDDSMSGFGSSPGFRALSPIHRRRESRELKELSLFPEATLQSPEMTYAQISAQRNFFRDALKATNDKVKELTTEFEQKIALVKASYEEKLMKARRSSTILSSPGGSEVEEQRSALAAMQNKLISERTEKQNEIDNLKRELQHLRKLAGSAEDLETLIGDLAKYEQELVKLRSQVNEMDELKEELGKLRAQNASLALATRSKNAVGTPNGSREKINGASDEKSDEVARLEQQLETKLLREAELEAMNEKLQEELNALKSASQPMTPDPDTDDLNSHSVIHQSGNSKPHHTHPAAPTAIPVPTVVESADYDESSMMVDFAAGRSDWCSLCEREGHSAVDCPYD